MILRWTAVDRARTVRIVQPQSINVADTRIHLRRDSLPMIIRVKKTKRVAEFMKCDAMEIVQRAPADGWLEVATIRVVRVRAIEEDIGLEVRVARVPRRQRDRQHATAERIAVDGVGPENIVQIVASSNRRG